MGILIYVFSEIQDYEYTPLYYESNSKRSHGNLRVSNNEPCPITNLRLLDHPINTTLHEIYVTLGNILLKLNK